ncbi:GTP 3',8-cyclase MoaA [Persicobacter psychrovividus]|uniref:GTP 3',8-cyclase n=1 Tax=Persicobacter psychrovividus TaxID=387638 RepID=A0ABM7VHK3_9BACT|nr:GTP 3',8-cyclase [Persicobacter psychrovividus]
MLIDKFGRPIKYLRLSVTDRCNLRCYYCMPEEGIKFIAHKNLLTYEEMLRLCTILVKEGVEKIRITGGEPFVRKELLFFLRELTKIKGLKNIGITSNGLLTAQYLEELKTLGITDLNLSLDCLSEEKFLEITRRKGLKEVLNTLELATKMGFKVKINTVVMGEKNKFELPALARLAQKKPIDVRFIEEMPFNGGEEHQEARLWTHQNIKDFLEAELQAPLVADIFESTAQKYSIEGWQGKIGIIPAHSRTFCGSCDRLRMTAQGEIRNCLYAGKGYNIKDLMRSGATDADLLAYFQQIVSKKAKNGFEAENRSSGHDSMSIIGG